MQKILIAILSQPSLDAINFVLLLFTIKTQPRVVTLGIFVSGIIEKSNRFIIFLKLKRVVGMAMALHTFKSSAQPNLISRVHTIQNRSNPKLFAVRSALIVIHCIPMKSRGDQLIFARLRQQVTSKLFNTELIIRHILVESPDHPVPVFPDLSRTIPFIALGIRIPSHVQPPGGPFLTILLRTEQAVHPDFV